MALPEIDREVRQDVAELLVRYATGIDRRDWPLLRSCFTDDCEADYGDIGRWHDAESITAATLAMLARTGEADPASVQEAIRRYQLHDPTAADAGNTEGGSA